MTILLGLFLLLSGCDEDRPHPTQMLDVAYGPEAVQGMDIYLPENLDVNTPKVLLMHGGAWAFGDKTEPYPTGCIAPLVEAGMIVCNLNFRYGNGDPIQQMEDVFNAIAAANTECARWGAGEGKVGLVGFSSGGHLALMFAHGFDAGAQVGAVVSVAGPTDLADSLFQARFEFHGFTWALEQFVGGTFDSIPGAYSAASPAYMAANTSTLLVHGNIDSLVPFDQSTRMRDQLLAGGFPCDLMEIEATGHDVFFQDTVAGRTIISNMTTWLKVHL